MGRGNFSAWSGFVFWATRCVVGSIVCSKTQGRRETCSCKNKGADIASLENKRSTFIGMLFSLHTEVTAWENGIFMNFFSSG